MAKTRKAWVFSSPKTPAPKVPVSVKVDVDQRASELVAMHLKPTHIQAPPAADEATHNYLTDIYTKWYRHYFYFCARYCSPGPNALAPFFEQKFARLEYTGPTGFTLSYMRYTGEWVELYSGLSLDQCLASVKDEPCFAP